MRSSRSAHCLGVADFAIVTTAPSPVAPSRKRPRAVPSSRGDWPCCSNSSWKANGEPALTVADDPLRIRFLRRQEQRPTGGVTMQGPFNRRRFLIGLAAAAATTSLPITVRAAMGPNDKFDLLIKGGDISIRANRFVAYATSEFATA